MTAVVPRSGSPATSENCWSLASLPARPPSSMMYRGAGPCSWRREEGKVVGGGVVSIYWGWLGGCPSFCAARCCGDTACACECVYVRGWPERGCWQAAGCGSPSRWTWLRSEEGWREESKKEENMNESFFTNKKGRKKNIFPSEQSLQCCSLVFFHVPSNSDKTAVTAASIQCC